MKKEELEKKMRDYKTTFIKKTDAPPARSGKSLYIRAEHHEWISKIVHVIGHSEITLYEYVDSVLIEHFNRYHEEIVNSFIEERIF